MKKMLALVFALGLVFTACKKGSPAGTYNLNKDAMVAKMKEEVTKLPKKQQGFGKLMLAMVKAMEVKLTLKKGGAAEMVSEVSFMGKKKESNDKGTWKKDGNKILITTTQIRKRGDKEIKRTRTITCTINKKSLSCKEDKKKDSKKKGPKMVLIFDKA